MNKIIALVLTGILYCAPASASILDDLKDQLITQTHVTATTSGGAASFYDFTQGNSSALRVGLLDHVLTNRFIQADAGWYTGTDIAVSGVAVFGPSIVLTDAFAYYFPDTSGAIKLFVPKMLESFFVGVHVGWGTDNWSPRYGVHFGKNF